MGESKKIRVEPRGLGDTLKNIFDTTGVTVVFEKAMKVLNIEDCGCDKRQVELNNSFPYKKEIMGAYILTVDFVDLPFHQIAESGILKTCGLLPRSKN